MSSVPLADAIAPVRVSVTRHLYAPLESCPTLLTVRESPSMAMSLLPDCGGYSHMYWKADVGLVEWARQRKVTERPMGVRVWEGVTFAVRIAVAEGREGGRGGEGGGAGGREREGKGGGRGREGGGMGGSISHVATA